jgi:Flp pilus assembly protein TadG
MLSFIRRKLAGLSGCTSGNATIIVALGMPMLIGGAGLGVDVAQWYMWKRELQFAVDQAAMAGAWARSSSSSTVRGTYQARALQEYNANLDIVDEFDTAPVIGLANYSTGTNNSVLVTSTATKSLPFSALITNEATTVAVRAQAVWSGGVDFHACMLALNKTASQAFKFGGSVSGSSACGAGTLSNNSNMAMKELGDNSVPLGTAVAAGQVDPTFSNNGTIYQNQEGLENPYEELEPPSSSGQTSRTYPGTCPVAQPESYTYTADGSTKTHNTYKYYKGANSNNWTEQVGYSGTGFVAASWSSPVTFTNKSVTSSATVGIQAETTAAAGTPVKVTGNGGNAIWRLPFTSTQDTNTAVIEHYTPPVDGNVYLSPGVYNSGLAIACDTVFSPGVYFVNGDLDFGQNKTVTGTGGVMFVLTSAGAIHINSNSNATLSGITSATLINDYGYDSDEAAKLAGMLIWDPDSTADFTMNGNSTLHLSGVFYMPKREAVFNGNSTASGNCIMVAADRIKIDGNFSLNNFCVTTGGSAMSIGGTNTGVRLVA